MSERYKKLYDLEHRLYAPGAPVLVDAGSLLLDQVSNAMLCQLRIRNIQTRPVKGIRAVVQMLDQQGAPLGKPVDHRYSDLDLRREDELGRDAAIVLPRREARSFSVRLSQISFEDGEVWTDEGLEWEALPDQPALVDHYGAEEALRLRRRLGSDCDYVALQAAGLWFCSCGAVNTQEESRCHKCRRRRSALPLIGDASLPGEDETDPESAAPAPGWKKLLPLGAGVLALAALAAAVFFLGPKMNSEPQNGEADPSPEQTELPQVELVDTQALAYEQAMALMEAEAYEEAQAAFAALGDYRDGPQKVQEIQVLLRAAEQERQYQEAKTLLDQGSYIQAREAFLALGNYEDSESMAQEALYRKAVALYGFIEAYDVKGVKAHLTVRTDEENLFSLPREKILELGSQGLASLQKACGTDPIRFVTESNSEAELLPIEEATAELFLALGNYKDSEELAAILPTMMDRSDEFFALCAEGKLEQAKDWLIHYAGDFADRELWLQRLELYLPFCRDWALYTGDPGLVPSITGDAGNCYSLRATVLLTEDGATLRLLNEDDASGPELYAEMGGVRFMVHLTGHSYLAEISDASGRLSVIKLIGVTVKGGAEYKGK